MVKLQANGTISVADIDYAYRKYPNEDIIIVMPNTKEQDAEKMGEIAAKYPQVKFSVTGGLNPAKKKFDNEHYQKRTYYSARELSKIISIYREIEKQIDLDWTETQKAMFVYKELCNKMEYSENVVNGRDYSRGIGGLIYNKAVCSGFAMIYKEALDRLGIECHYQNREGHHSWNIAKLDGKHRAVELTWDTSRKGKNGCGFYYFNRKGENFYANEHHDIKHETEEEEFPITQYTDEELIEAYKVISKPRVLKIPLDVSQKRFAESGKFEINGRQCVIIKENTGNIILRCVGVGQRIASKTFIRDDGTHFILIQNTNNDPQLSSFIIVDETKRGVQIGKIYSEENLIALPREYDDDVANGLLSNERLKRKINDFNGYVGYIGNNHSIYYNSDIERNRLNVLR